MKVPTIPGANYALTCKKACNVTALFSNGSSIAVLSALKAGQYVFIAPSDVVEVSDDKALVTQSFKSAAPGLAAQSGGVEDGDDAVLRNVSAEGLSVTGTVNANGGVNIPPAAPPPMTDHAVSRIYAQGLSCLDALCSAEHLIDDANCLRGDGTKLSPLVATEWQQVSFNSSGSRGYNQAKIAFNNSLVPRSGNHYRTLWLPLRLNWNTIGAERFKLTFALGEAAGMVSAFRDSMDDWDIRMSSTPVYNDRTIVEVLFDCRNANDNKITVRTRMAYYSGGYKVRTTMADWNTFYQVGPESLAGLMLANYKNPLAPSDNTDSGAIWAVSASYSIVPVFRRIASLNASVKLASNLMVNSQSVPGGRVLYVGRPRAGWNLDIARDGRYGTTYAALEAMGTNIATSVMTEDFTNPVYND